MERLITHFSWILEIVEELAVVLKVLVVLEAILDIAVEAVEIGHLSFVISVFLYCRKGFYLLLKMVFIDL